MDLDEIIEELVELRSQHGGRITVRGYTDGAYTDISQPIKIEYDKGCSCCGRPLVRIEV